MASQLIAESDLFINIMVISKYTSWKRTNALWHCDDCIAFKWLVSAWGSAEKFIALHIRTLLFSRETVIC
jgi:hypothetical protein